MAQLSQKESFEIASSYQFDTECLSYGPWTSYSLLNDPKHMSFVLARYKFCAKMLQGKATRLEVGCGDGFGMPITAQDAEYVLGIDVDDRLIEGNSQRLSKLKNVEFKNMSIVEQMPDRKFDGVYSVDVVEHLDADIEKAFMENSVRCLKRDGVYIMGTPNITANEYASERSRIQHINLKSDKDLRALLGTYFDNVFTFGMNDEVVHTGYAPMSHYLWAVGVGLKEAYVTK